MDPDIAPRFEFTVPGGTPGMDAAITWLIQIGGQAHIESVRHGGANLGYLSNVRVTKATIDALERRGLVVALPGLYGKIVQITPKAITGLCSLTVNPHPAPVMQAAAEFLARRERP